MKRLLLLPVLLIVISFSFQGCGEPEVTVDTLNDTSNDSLPPQDFVEIESEAFDFMLPSSLQIAEMLMDAGLNFDLSLPNDPENVSVYASNTHKLLNFGSYSADMAYCVLSDQTEPALKYLQAIEGLTDDLGLSAVFHTEDLVRTFENNSTNQDSLITVLINVQERLDEYVDESDERFMHVVIMSGAWIEFMYLGANGADENGRVHHQLSEQMILLESLIQGLETNPAGDQRIADLVVAMQDLKNSYDNMESVLNYDGDDESPVLSADELAELGTKVEQIRQSIVEA